MRARTSFLIAALCLSATSLFAQEQQQGQGTAPQGATVVQASTVDSQGIVKYLLGPGDTLDVRVFGQPDLNWVGEVDADGNISSLPFVEKPIPARCRTEKEIQKDVIAAYSKILRNPQVSVRITGRNSRPPATIMGAVLSPARVQMMRRVRLNELLAASGGLTERSNGDIQVLHTAPVMCPEPGDEIESDSDLKIYKYTDLVMGKPDSNPVIRPGDIVNVMDAKPIYITGMVNSPQPIYLREGLTLSTALAMVGGVRQGEAKTSDIRIYRVKAGQPDRDVVRADLSAIKKKKSEDVVLQPYDVIEVPKTSDWDPGRLLRNLAGSVMSLGGSPAQLIQYKVMY